MSKQSQEDQSGGGQATGKTMPAPHDPRSKTPEQTDNENPGKGTTLVK